jgi:hypothetical protein
MDSDADGTVFIGQSAGAANTSGRYNTAVGFESFKTNVDGDFNTAIGYQALETMEPSGGVGNNTVVGYNAAQALTTGSSNVAIGSVALGTGAVTGSDNIAIGKSAGEDITSGSSNILIGTDAGYKTTDVDKAVIIGTGAAGANMTADADGTIAIGYQAGLVIADGQFNTVVGYQALKAQVSGDSSTAIGYQALKSSAISSGDVGNTAIGYKACEDLTTGQANIAIGRGAMSTTTTGGENICIGVNAMDDTDAGSTSLASGQNIFIGTNSGGGTWVDANTQGNVGVGTNTMNGALDGALSNTCIGQSAGNDMRENDYCVAIGYNAQASANDATQEITLGDSNITVLRCNDTSIGSLSDQRDKTDVEDYPSSGGLNFINKLRPVLFTWDKRQWYGEPDEEYNEENGFPEGHIRENVLGTSDGSKKSAVKDAEHPFGGARMGFLAQELETAIDEVDAEFMKNMDMVYKSNPERLETKIGDLITPLVKAIQELSAKVTALENA